MSTSRGVPEVSVQQLAAKLSSADGFILLDVREPWEVARAGIQDERLSLAPMSALGQRGVQGLPEAAQDKQAEIYVLCHHGVRSAQVTGWLRSRGWNNIFSVAGGIDAYAVMVDEGVGKY